MVLICGLPRGAFAGPSFVCRWRPALRRLVSIRGTGVLALGSGVFQPNRVVGVSGHGHHGQAVVAQQRGDDVAVLSAASRLPAGRDRPGQPGRLIVAGDLREARPCRKQSTYLRLRSASRTGRAGQVELPSREAGDLDAGASEADGRHEAGDTRRPRHGSPGSAGGGSPGPGRRSLRQVRARGVRTAAPGQEA